MSKQCSKRSLTTITRLLIVLAFLLPLGAIHAQPAVAQPATGQSLAAPVTLPFCTIELDPLSKSICKHITGNPTIPGTGGINLPSIPGIPSASSIITNDIVYPILDQIAKAEASAVSSVLQSAEKYIENGATPTFSAEWFRDQYGVIFIMAIFVGVSLLTGRLTYAVKELDAGEAASGLAAWVVLIVGGGFIPIAVGGILKVTDGPLTKGWLDGPGNSIKKTLSSIVKQLTANHNYGAAVALPVLFLAAGVVGGAATEVIFEFRDFALYVATSAELLAFALLIGGRATIDGFLKLTYWLIGLILLRPILAILFSTGLHLLSKSSQGSDPVVLGAVFCIATPGLSIAAYRAISKHNVQPGNRARQAVNTVRTVIVTVAA